MNPDDTNQGGGTPPADDTGAGTPAAAPEPMGGGSEPTTPAPDMGGGAPAEAPADAAGTNCHCGKTSSGGNCSGCNLPEASCSCQPTA